MNHTSFCSFEFAGVNTNVHLPMQCSARGGFPPFPPHTCAPGELQHPRGLFLSTYTYISHAHRAPRPYSENTPRAKGCEIAFFSRQTLLGFLASSATKNENAP